MRVRARPPKHNATSFAQSVLTLPSARSLQAAPLPSTATQPTVLGNVCLGDLGIWLLQLPMNCHHGRASPKRRVRRSPRSRPSSSPPPSRTGNPVSPPAPALPLTGWAARTTRSVSP